MDRRGFITKGLVFFAGLGLAACQHDRRDEPFGRGRGVYRYNRPPHAPEDGYRHAYAKGFDLIYDSRIGGYRVVGRTDYYYRGRFYRLLRGQWYSRGDIDQQWYATSPREIPRRMRRDGERKEKSRQRRRQRKEDAD
jgi:hypothetical protein